MKPLLKCLGRVNALVFGGWLFVTPPGNDVKRPLKECQERSFDTLQECESRERQADEFIKRMETVPEGSSAFIKPMMMPPCDIYWVGVPLLSSSELNREGTRGRI
jgi:hypothetical protein